MSYQDEIKEARSAGRRALISLEEAREALKSAGKWGLVDIFLSEGGGLFSTFMKHQRLSRAEEALSVARRDLEIFNSELRDVSREIKGPDISTFLTLLDFMDSFLVEIMVQKRISDAREAVEDAIYKVQEILEKL